MITTTTTKPDDETLAVWCHKHEWAGRLGFEPEACEEIATDDLDLHLIERLVERGCAHGLAIEIAR